MQKMPSLDESSIIGYHDYSPEKRELVQLLLRELALQGLSGELINNFQIQKTQNKMGQFLITTTSNTEQITKITCRSGVSEYFHTVPFFMFANLI
tara:strand:+ start:179 stop:463 length:285 start_codon:yes stop_codon:yes gene_type:complete